MTFRLGPLPRPAVKQVAHLVLPASQAGFVGSVSEMTAAADPLQDFHLCQDGETVVGFFKIDRDFSRRIASLPAGAHGLRGVLIGGQYQRRGYGRSLLASLPGYIRSRYGARTLWLSVDCENTRAIALYAHSGWRDWGPLFQGRSGMERVMRLTV